VLYSFGGKHGVGPDSPLVIRGGNIYGTTSLLIDGYPGLQGSGGLVFELLKPAKPGGKQGAHRRSLELGLQQARYQAGLAERRYEAVDPAQRLVAGELEARWNVALEREREAEVRCAEYDQRMETTGIPSKESLVSLAHDLPEVWNTSTDLRLKQRIVHLVLREIIADVDPVSYKVT
jgi:hypothetical protein